MQYSLEEAEEMGTVLGKGLAEFIEQYQTVYKPHIQKNFERFSSFILNSPLSLTAKCSTLMGVVKNWLQLSAHSASSNRLVPSRHQIFGLHVNNSKNQVTIEISPTSEDKAKQSKTELKKHKVD